MLGFSSASVPPRIMSASMALLLTGYAWLEWLPVLERLANTLASWADPFNLKHLKLST